jgi:hypothetical protein
VFELPLLSLALMLSLLSIQLSLKGCLLFSCKSSSFVLLFLLLVVDLVVAIL